MTHLIKQALLALALVLTVTTSYAVAPAVDRQTLQYLNSTEFKRLVYQLGVNWDRKALKLQMECTGQYTVSPVSFAVLKPLHFAEGATTPDDGIWTYRYRFTRCDETIIYNVISQAKPDSPPKVMPLFPGTSNVSPILFRDVFIGGVATSVAAQSADGEPCKAIHISDTTVTMPPTNMVINDTSYEGVWEEKWMIQHCGKELALNFCFTPKPEGGTTWAVTQCKRPPEATE